MRILLSETLAVDNYYIMLYHFAALFILVAFNFALYLRARKNLLLLYYLLTQAAIFIWMLAKILKTVSPTAEVRWLFISLQYAGVYSLPFLLFTFSYLYRYGRKPGPAYIYPLAALSVVSFVIVATNPLHMRFYSYYDLYTDRFGPLFYTLQACSYLPIIMGIILCAGSFKADLAQKKMQARLFAAGILLPLAMNGLFIASFTHIRFHFDITPLACTVSLSFFSAAIYRFRMFDIVPAARRKTLDYMPDYLALTDEAGQVIDLNQRFRACRTALRPAPPRTEAGCFIAGLLECTEQPPTGISGLLRDDPLPPEFDVVYETMEGRQIRAIGRQAGLNSGKTGLMIRLTDISRQIRTFHVIADRNLELSSLNCRLSGQLALTRELAASKVRSALAQELHDVLGHSMVLAISILEVARLSCRENRQAAQEKVGQAARLLEGCLAQLRSSLENDPPADIRHRLFDSIRMMSEEAGRASVELNLTIQGDSYDLPEQYQDMLFKVCREAVTNAIRHGAAARVDLVFRFSASACEVYIIDDGRGCSLLVKGHGLLGMESRAQALGGSVRFASDGEKGFIVHVSVPPYSGRAS